MTSNISISSSAMLVDLSIGTWTARKLDKKVTDEVNTSKNASSQASRVNKNLLPGVDQLEKIVKYGAMVRNWVYDKTLPWSDYGPRLIPTAAFFDFKRTLDEHEAEFNRLVDKFIAEYPTLISAQAFKLGDMFSRDEYPDVEDIASKFRFRATFLPVPDSGDFRVDIGNEAMDVLREQYEREYLDRLNGAIADVRTRLLEGLHHLSDRLSPDDNGDRKRFRNNMLETFAETVASVRALNLTKDEAIESLALEAERAVAGVDIDIVKENDTARANVLARVNSVLEAFEI